MKKFSLYTLMVALMVVAIQACGPSEEERRAQEQARLDSLMRVEQQKVEALKKAREDSLAKVREENAQDAGEMEDESSSGSSGDIQFAEDGSYAVQVGAWRSEDKANKFLADLEDRNYPSSYVIKVGEEATGDIWYRVRVGFFADKAAAEKLGTRLADEFNTGYWVTLVR